MKQIAFKVIIQQKKTEYDKTKNNVINIIKHCISQNKNFRIIVFLQNVSMIINAANWGIKYY